MSRAAGKAKQNIQTHAGARVPTALYRRVMAKVGAEGTTLRQVLMDLLEAYVQDNGHVSTAPRAPTHRSRLRDAVPPRNEAQAEIC